MNKKSLLSLISIAFLGGLVGRGLRYLFNVVIARGLGAEALGYFAFGMVVMKALAIISRFGLDTAAQKFIPEYINEENNAKLSGLSVFVLVFPIAVGTLLAIGGYAFFEWVSFGPNLEPEEMLFLLGVPFWGAMMVGRTATTGFKETQYSVYIRDLIQPISGIVLISFGIYYIVDIRAAIIGYILSLVIGMSSAGYFLFRLGAFSKTPTFKIRYWLSFSGPVVIVAVAQYIVSWTDILMLRVFVQPTEIGWYQASYQTSVLLTITLSAVNSIFPTIASDLYTNGNLDKLDQIYSAVTKWITYFTLLGALFILIYTKEILLIFNITAQPAQTALTVLVFGQFVAASTGPVGFLLTMSGYERLESLNTTVLAVVNIILNLFLIQRFGMVGAAIATATSFLILNAIRLIEVTRIHGIQPYNRSYWKGAVCTMVSFAVMLILYPFAQGSFIRMIVVGAVALCTFLIGIYLIGFDKRDRQLIQAVK